MWVMRKLENHWYEIGFYCDGIFTPRYHVKWRVVADAVLKLLQGRKSQMTMEFFIHSLGTNSEIKEV